MVYARYCVNGEGTKLCRERLFVQLTNLMSIDRFFFLSFTGEFQLSLFFGWVYQY